jgi:hypothetical protein
MHLFGKVRNKPNAKDAIIRLRETQQMLQKREAFLQTKIDAELQIAKANATKNKRGKSMIVSMWCTHWYSSIFYSGYCSIKT